MSAIHRVIGEHGLDTFEKIKTFFSQAPYHVRVVDDTANNLYLLKYDQIKTDFSHPAALEARGIILEKGTNRIVCYPFTKFFNAGEKYAADIDWQTASVQHKYDGSIIKLYWLGEKSGRSESSSSSSSSSSNSSSSNSSSNASSAIAVSASTEGGRWMVATNGTTDARNAPADEQRGTTFYDLFKDAEKTANLDYARLDKDCTYMFELMHPDQLIVVRYKEPRLIHIGTRNNKTFRESYESIGVAQAEVFPLNTLDACREAATLLGPSQEGFVVCDSAWRRVKIKGTVYVKLHHTLTNNYLSDEEVAAQLILQGEQSEVLAYKEDERLAKICQHIDAIETKLDLLTEKLEKLWKKVMDAKPASRKEIAMAFKKEAGVYFPLMMSRVTAEGGVGGAGEPLKSFFRKNVIEKFSSATITRTDACEFLEFIKTN